ncbi:hypothetical protein A3715_03530 [Oleiphilus sp. HI0009]|uniref:PEP-CTERM sorting domain-containing protein n=2 Tax=Oleiphilus TaxID=141450 RepID=UPI0007C3D143|nr:MULTISPECIES: PEP-CTERM sorting domain-containing protein [unclassified Oleiphilus]KZX85996.1 hypothetical protein A3715_03530 [Oleiphilus sp. HI0009]KZY74195.1 hypothetical protein A3739_14895 [Oleiphilus sp. HI0067]KZZ58857.1 hypothetical protein A3762_00680 [Oleiphilus sp. HI0125]MCH2160122.1 PEP-CTERM sorting domain-containing protein [Oleiphilaceae bacterium]
MNFQKLIAALMLGLASTSAFAATITFVSAIDDKCRYMTGCLLNDQTTNTYIDPIGTELEGASWVQPTGVWKEAGVEYRVWELDLNRPNQDMRIDSLFVSFDDDLQIRSKGKILADINRYDVAGGNPWAQVINVYDYVNSSMILEKGGRLNFWVTNSGNGPTGIIYKGTASTVSEPAAVAILGLGLFCLGVARRRAV